MIRKLDIDHMTVIGLVVLTGQVVAWIILPAYRDFCWGTATWAWSGIF